MPLWCAKPLAPRGGWWVKAERGLGPVGFGLLSSRLGWAEQGQAGPGRAGAVVSSYYGYLGASFLSTIIFLISVNVSLCVCASVVRKSICVCVAVVVVCSIFACYWLRYNSLSDSASFCCCFFFLFFRHFCSLSRWFLFVSLSIYFAISFSFLLSLLLLPFSSLLLQIHTHRDTQIFIYIYIHWHMWQALTLCVLHSRSACRSRLCL